MKETAFLTPPPLKMSEETPTRNTPMNPSCQNTHSHLIGPRSYWQWIRQHRHSVVNYGIFRKQEVGKTDFLKVGQKIQSGDNKNGAHSRLQFSALPKPQNKPWILLCPSSEDIKQELRLHRETALLTLLSKPHSRKRKNRQDELLTESRWEGGEMDL